MALAFAAAVLAACGGDGGTEPKTPQLASMSIVQKLDTLSELSTRALTLTGTDTQGQPFTVTGVTWQSSDTTRATVGANGEVAGVRPGTATITARSGTVSTTLALQIVKVPVRTVSVRLVGGVSGDTLLVGTTATLVAEARDVAGRLLLDRPVTMTVADPSVATIDGGKITGAKVGLAEVTLQSDSITRRQQVVVRPAFAAKIAIRMLDPRKLGDTTWAGLRDSALVTFTDSAGNTSGPSSVRPVTFASDNPSVATVDPYGRVTFLAAGTTTIRATGDKLVAAKQLVAVRAPVTTVIGVPDTVRIVPGGVSQIRPVLVDGGGLRVTSLAGHTLTFQSLTPSIATVDAQGNVTGVATGRAQIRLTSDRGTGTVPVQVYAASGDQAFRITLRFVGPTPASYVVDAFEAAKARWEKVIRRTTGTYVDTLAQNSCSNPEDTHEERITDVVIYARIDSIDGPSQVLGRAGPCYIKEVSAGRWMASVGEMAFDSADMKLMQEQELLTNVITHEMGHVLGIGTMWRSQYHAGTALAAQGGTNPTYSGVRGVNASAGMGYTSFTLNAAGDPTLDRVLLENTGGAGTAGSHWRRSIYGNELMNGYAGKGEQPLSLLTVMAMADMGYEVNTSAAEWWGARLFTASSASLGRLPQIFAGPAMSWGEQLVEPKFATDRFGRRRRLGADAAR